MYDKIMFAASFLVWYIFGFLGLGVNFAVRFLRTIATGDSGIMSWTAWQERHSVKIGRWPAWQIIIFAAMGGYTILYAILIWLGTHWNPNIITPFWRVIICEGFLEPSPASAILAPLSLAGFEWLVGRAQKEIEKKIGDKLPDPIPPIPKP